MYSRLTPQNKIEALRRYFESRDDVVMAFIFGSRAKGRARMRSDWDIGVYLVEESREREEEIWGGVEKIVGTEVDMVVLNRAPASLAWTIVRAGIPLTLKDRRIYLRFFRLVSREANAWYRTVEKYHRVFERSASLSQEDREQLQRTIQFMEREAEDFEKFRHLTWQEYSADRPKQREVERWAEQLMNAAIDVAQVVLASSRRVVPETYRMMVQTLGTIPPFDQSDLCEKLAPWTELRNLLAHEYLDYRWKELSAFIAQTPPLFEVLISRTKEFLAMQ